MRDTVYSSPRRWSSGLPSLPRGTSRFPRRQPRRRRECRRSRRRSPRRSGATPSPRPAGFADWHPTQREMLITTRFADTAQVHHVKMPGGARTQLTFFNEPVARRDVRAGRRATTSSSPRTSAATSSTSSTATTSPPATSRCSPTAAVAKRRPRLEHRRQAARLRLHAPQWQGQRPLRHRSRRPEDRPARDAGRRRRLGRSTGRPTTANSWSASTSRPTRATSGWSTSRPARRSSPPSRREGRVRRGPVRRRRPRRLRHHRQGRRVPPPRLRRRRDARQLTHSHRHQVGRRGRSTFRPTARRSPSPPTRTGVVELYLLDTARQRGCGRSARAPSVISGAGVARATAATSPSRCLAPAPPPTPTRSTPRRARSSAGPTARPAASARTLVRAEAGPLEELRRPGALRLLLPAAEKVHRQAPGDRQHPRRPRGPVRGRLHRPQQLLPQRARRRHHLPQRPRLHRLRQDVPRARQRR